MKLFVLLSLILSTSVFAGRVGYNCVAANPIEQQKLNQIAMTIGPQYKASIGVIMAKPRDCADVVRGLRAQCLVGSYNLNVFDRQRAELVVNPQFKIKLICEADAPVYPQPGGGGSN